MRMVPAPTKRAAEIEGSKQEGQVEGREGGGVGGWGVPVCTEDKKRREEKRTGRERKVEKEEI